MLISLKTQSSQGGHFWNKDYVYVLRSEWMSVPHTHTQIHVEILMPSDGIKKWGFCQVLRSWGRSPLNGMSAFIKEMPQSSWVPPPQFLPPLEDTTRSLQSARRPSPSHAGTLILDLQFPELWEKENSVYKLSKKVFTQKCWPPDLGLAVSRTVRK